MTWQTRIFRTVPFIVSALSVIVVSAGQRDPGTVPGNRAAVVAASGTATLSGAVVTSDQTPRPVRRAIVAVSGGGLTLSRNAITDDEGRFVVTGLAAGRYVISASRAGYVTVAYGAVGPGRPGSPVAIEAGQQLSGLRVQLARGAVIAGTIRDASGEALAGVEVTAERRERNGTVLPAGPTLSVGARGTAAMTDDTGAYRLFGLPPGDYLVSARLTASGAGDLMAPSDAEVDAAMRDLQQRTTTAGVTRAGTAPAQPSVALPSGKTVTVLPIYYPDAVSPDDATAIRLGVGEERLAVDLTARFLAATSVAGTIVAPSGQVMPAIQLRVVNSAGQSLPGLLASVGAGSDGRFRFTNVPPGKYTIVATSTSPLATRYEVGLITMADVVAAGGFGPCYFASTDFTSLNDDLTGLSVALHPCVTLSGQIVLTGTSPQPPDLTKVQVSQMRRALGSVGSFTRNLRVTPVTSEGKFVLPQLVPGTYYLAGAVPESQPGRGWWLTSVLMNGRDLLDEPIVIDETTEAAPTAVMHFSDVHSSLTGTLQSGGGVPASEYTVIVFPSNREWWREPFRRVQAARPASDGGFIFHDLPAGTYLLAALTDLVPGDAQDSEFLSALVGSAVSVAIGVGEKKVQDLRIGAAR